MTIISHHGPFPRQNYDYNSRSLRTSPEILLWNCFLGVAFGMTDSVASRRSDIRIGERRSLAVTGDLRRPPCSDRRGGNWTAAILMPVTEGGAAGWHGNRCTGDQRSKAKSASCGRHLADPLQCFRLRESNGDQREKGRTRREFSMLRAIVSVSAPFSAEIHASRVSAGDTTCGTFRRILDRLPGALHVPRALVRHLQVRRKANPRRVLMGLLQCASIPAANLAARPAQKRYCSSSLANPLANGGREPHVGTYPQRIGKRPIRALRKID